MPPSKPAASTSAPKAHPLYGATDLVNFQKLVGGIPIGTITAFFGAPEAGKSSLAAQLAVEYAVTNNGHAAIHDTELNQHTWAPLVQRLSKRFSEAIHLVRVKPKVTKKRNAKGDDDQYEVAWNVLNPEPKEGTILYVIECPDIDAITHLYGRGAVVGVSDGGKVDIDLLNGSWARTPSEIPLVKFLREKNVQSLVIDSVTNPLDEIPAKTKNFPGRSDLTQLWLVQTGKMAWEMEIPVFMVAHETKNDAGAFSKELDIEGGKGVRYNCKHMLYLLIKNERGLLPGEAPKPGPIADTGRTLFAARIPGVKSWSKFVTLDMTENGISDYKS